MNDTRPCIFGEVLFDHFPDGSRVLGGAPFNVAWHLQAFGQRPRFISRIGDDSDGNHIRAAMRAWGMDTDGLQTDDALPTGRVTVTIADGEPHYDIVHPSAYDAIAHGNDSNCGLLYHGSLALRSAASRAALEQLTGQPDMRVFLDVNLRPPWWNRDDLHALLHRADWVKLNSDELEQLQEGREPDDAATTFVDAFELQGLILTHGERGAEVLTRDGHRERIAPRTSGAVVDTVGAGDAFASVMILGLLRDWPLRTTLVRAQAFASRIVGVRGATVDDAAFYRTLSADWS